ncbi:AraC family transcriptional regulator [Promicromonospora kroppenstedtii]|uniref:AraC family transcriptional regulator n=1 Tax=Promicromonospora kroppenstedtii TaxID=440482 RepID=UPI00068418C6|nr:AraC family transcriptional regulator [Promicromonospora kroppenstedtii]
MPSAVSYASSTFPPDAGPSDPVADAIGLLRPRTVVYPALRAGGSWKVRFEAFPHVKIGGVVRGDTWLALDGREPVHLREGDFYLLSNPPAYSLGSGQSIEPLPAATLWETAAGGAVRIGSVDDEDTYLCGGYFWFDELNAPILLDILPPLVHVRADDPRIRSLAYVTELLSGEVGTCAIGSSLILDHLVQILLVQVLRAHAEQSDRPVGWLGALVDDGVGAALRAMHSNVAHRWTVEELAGISHLSRSGFAKSFKRQVGLAPLEYLIQWRMSLARDALRRNTQTISELAFAIGYESESAFSTAFRRVVGASPKQFRDRALRPAGAEGRRDELAVGAA